MVQQSAIAVLAFSSLPFQLSQANTTDLLIQHQKHHIYRDPPSRPSYFPTFNKETQNHEKGKKQHNKREETDKALKGKDLAKIQASVEVEAESGRGKKKKNTVVFASFGKRKVEVYLETFLETPLTNAIGIWWHKSLM